MRLTSSTASSAFLMSFIRVCMKAIFPCPRSEVGHAREDFVVLHAVLAQKNALDLVDGVVGFLDVLHPCVHEGDLSLPEIGGWPRARRLRSPPRRARAEECA